MGLLVAHLEAFNAANIFSSLIGVNDSYPDLDVLPLGYGFTGIDPIEGPHWTNLLPQEQFTLMSLWSFARSPLIMAGLLPTDNFTVNLLTNSEILKVNHYSKNNRQHFGNDTFIIWMAEPVKETGEDNNPK